VSTTERRRPTPMTSPRPPPQCLGPLGVPGRQLFLRGCPPFFTPAAPLSPDLLLRIRTDQADPAPRAHRDDRFASTVSSGPGRPLNGSRALPMSPPALAAPLFPGTFSTTVR